MTRRAPARSSSAGTYLYGIIRAPDPSKSRIREVLGTGVGTPPSPVRLLRFGDLAAVVGTVDAEQIGERAGARAFMRDMAAHADVLDRVLKVRTVLPARMGLFFPDDRSLIREMLEPQHDLLLDLLRRLSGTVELRVTAAYLEDQVLDQIICQQPQLAGRQGATYTQRIETGRRIARAIASRRDTDARWILDQLVPAARDVSVADGSSELTVLRASFLVERKALGRFDGALERVQTEAGDVMRLACVGPLPPYSFADLRLEPTTV